MNITLSMLLQLKQAADLIKSVEGSTAPPLTDTLLDQLVKYTIIWHDGVNSGDFTYLFQKPYRSACGCMGPRYDAPFCVCAMSDYMYDYRYDIAIKILISLSLNNIKDKLINDNVV